MADPELAWLVERNDLEGLALYFYAAHNRMAWTSDPDSALRFSRKEDAQMFINAFYSHQQTVTATGHSWAPCPSGSEIM